MTGAQYIYDVKMMLRNNHITDEDLLSDRLVEFWIVSQRATWIKKRDSAYIKNDHSLSQVLTTPIVSVDRSFLPDRVPSDYRILRSQEKLPELINFTSWDGIISAGPIDMASLRFNHVEYREAIASGHGRFNKGQIYSFVLNGYLYLISRSVDNEWYLISQAGVIGIFSNPREVGNFVHVTGDPCWSINDEYPISIDLWNYMKDEIRKVNIDTLANLPVDRSNDDSDIKIDRP